MDYSHFQFIQCFNIRELSYLCLHSSEELSSPAIDDQGTTSPVVQIGKEIPYLQLLTLPVFHLALLFEFSLLLFQTNRDSCMGWDFQGADNSQNSSLELFRAQFLLENKALVLDWLVMNKLPIASNKFWNTVTVCITIFSLHSIIAVLKKGSPRGTFCFTLVKV
jgi:hypothetical protein